jgi:hypothetical protein
MVHGPRTLGYVTSLYMLRTLLKMTPDDKYFVKGVVMSKQTKEHIEARISKIRGIKKGPSPFRKTTEQIVSEIKTSHGDRYLLDRVDYVNSSTKIEVGCKVHGYFFKWPNDMKGRGGCPKCGNSFSKTTDDFLNEARNIFPNYDYSKVDYKNSHTKVEVGCPKHGYFMIKPNTLLSDSGCSECGTQRALITRIEKGQCRHPDDITEHEKYKIAVWKETDKNFKKYFIGENRNRDNHLDHIVSITDGWINKVPPEIIGSRVNLRLLDGITNRKKSNKSDMTIEILYTKYKEMKDIE